MYVTNPVSQHFRTTKSGLLTVFCRGLLMCERPFNANTTFYVNLPFSGFYSFSGDGFVKMGTTPLIKSELNITLPPPERVRNFGVNKITFDNLSNSPARIYTTENTIVLNPKFLSYPIEIRLFILLHEVGHFYYKTEWKCDQYAAHHFLQMGCNPSQAFDSLAGVLHTEKADGTTNFINMDRVNKIYKLLTIK